MVKWLERNYYMSNLTYYPDDKTKFNGILIILREPHDERNISNASGALEGNKIWFQEIISNNVRRTRQESRYRNRFIEMISYCGDREIENIAFANIKLQGGGCNASSEYWEKDKKAAFNAIIEEIGKENLRYIFVCISSSKNHACQRANRREVVKDGK